MANLKNTEKKTKAQSMGMHSEVLTGRTQQKFFNPDEGENLYYFGTYDVDFNKRTELDVKEMTAPEANKEIDNLMMCGAHVCRVYSSPECEAHTTLVQPRKALAHSCEPMC